MSYGKYKGCETCWSDAKKFAHEKDMECFGLKCERDDAIARLQAKEKCIDWVWCVRWTTPNRKHGRFVCEASEDGLRVFSCREDAIQFVKSIKDMFAEAKKRHDEEMKSKGCTIVFGPRSGGGYDEHPEEVGNYVDYGNGYSVCIQCRAVNSSPCSFGREFDINGEVKEVAND